MTTTEKLLEGSMLTEQQMLKDLTELSGYYDMIEVPSKVLPVGEQTPLPVLTAILSDEDGTRALTHSFIPLDTEDAEFTKFLQFYTEEAMPEKPIDRVTLLEAICALNGVLPMGSCFLLPGEPEKELPARVGIRSTQGYALEESIDRGAFCESVFLFDTSCGLVSFMLDGLAEGKSVETILQEMRQ